MNTLPPDTTLRHELNPGDIGYLLYLHGSLYADEYGFDHTFEAGMAGSLAEFVTSRSEGDRFWLVDFQDQLAGSVPIDGTSETEAELRWLLLHPDLRGRGLGRHLLQRALAFCEETGYETVFLWTVDRLETARRLYESVGFERTHESTEHRWGQSVTMQRYEKELP
jgi:GNAT superfamily N-acetyltransferase